MKMKTRLKPAAADLAGRRRYAGQVNIATMEYHCLFTLQR